MIPDKFDIPTHGDSQDASRWLEETTGGVRGEEKERICRELESHIAHDLRKSAETVLEHSDAWTEKDLRDLAAFAGLHLDRSILAVPGAG